MSFDSSRKNDLWKVLSNSVLHLDENTEMTIFSWTHTLLLNRVKISVYSCVDSRPLVISVLGVLVHFLHLKRVLDISLNLYDNSFLIEYGMLRKWPKLLFLCDPEMRERMLFLLMRNSSLFFWSLWIMIVPDVFCGNDLNTYWSTVSYKPDIVYLS